MLQLPYQNKTIFSYDIHNSFNLFTKFAHNLPLLGILYTS